MTRLTGVMWNEGKAFFFRGDEYVRYDVAAERVDEGYPAKIAGAWPGLFSSAIDAAVVWPNGKAFFFKSDQYARYDIAADRADEGYPRNIADGWPGVFGSGIDAAVVWPNGKAFFFKGDQYVRYDIAADRADESYPAPIASGWPGVFTGGVDLALLWSAEKAYFFKGDEYVRYDVAADRADEGYPASIASGWNGLTWNPGQGAATPGTQPSGAMTAHGTYRSVRDAFIAFNTPLEARVHWMYADVKGLVTTGIGNLLASEAEAQKLPWVRPDGSPADPGEVAAEWRLVRDDSSLRQAGHRAAEKVTRLRLTDAAIDELVLEKFDGRDAQLSRFYGNWRDWPADAQLGALSISWAGAGFPNAWPKFNAHADARDWAECGDESHLDTTGNAGVAHRNEANLRLFTNAARVEASSADKSVLHYPAAP